MLFKDNGHKKTIAIGAEEESKNTQFKLGVDLPIYWKKQSSQPMYLAKHLPKTNAVLNQSSMRFVGHRKVLQREP